MKRYGFRIAATALGAAACAWVAAFAIQPAFAQQAVIAKGDAVVTGFSGTKTDKDVPADVHPLDRTFIDIDGASAHVFDLSVLGTSPRGQVSDVPAKLTLKAVDTGQLFGVTIDDDPQPNAYLTATSMFGLQIISKDGERLVTGEADAKWMAGQFGPQSNPGAIYKLDGATGKVSLFATLKHDGRDNAGPALGNITFDRVTRRLFVSDLETGLIHSLSLSGEDRSQFDHGKTGRAALELDQVAFDATRRMNITSAAFDSEDPATWGYADARRRVFGLAVSKGRLYYAVAEGPSIWSVSIADNGAFGSDARIELEPTGTTASADITDIVFDGAGVMILSQRGAITGNYDYSEFAKPQQASVLRYTYSEAEGRWLAAPQEYAVGLKPDFRATQGGVALSYGYDKFGTVNYGACRQTLWTTGEHLREGDDIVRVASGGARVVSGLQGSYKSRVRPANAPPIEAWFTDYDGRNEDTQAFGHIGDVAIYAPCEPAPGQTVAPDDAATIAPMIPPLDQPGLTVEKVCHPGAIGGKIRCTILVRNLTGQIVSEDIKFTDVTKTMFGPGAGSIIPIVAAVPLNPGVQCAATPTTDFWCSMPSVMLLPGEAAGVDVFIDTHDLALGGNLGFRNCAVLKHPNGYAKACAEGGTDIVVEKIGPGFCLPGNTCKFGLKIANVGTMPYNGDVLLADAMFVGGAPVNAAVTAVNPPVACSAGNMAQLPFTCVTTLSLMPGEEHIHWVDVTMPAPGGYWAKNCFGALDPALLPLGPVPPGLGGGGAGNPSCVWVHVPVPEANIKLEKTALNGGLCDKVGGNLHCKYEIAVTNMDAIAYNAPLKIKESVPAGATLIAATAPWACAGGPPDYTCDTGGAVNILPGGKTAFNVTISIPVAASEASMCKVPNTAKIVDPVAGAAPNLQAGDDADNAIASTFGLFWEDPITGITFVMCDPTNLKVEKTATGDCETDGGQYTCGYKVTVTNMGPDPFKGPVKLDENFASAPASVTFGGDFACNGAGANYKCATPIVDLAKGARLTLTVNATVSGSGVCELANTATMTSPPAGSKGNGNGGDDSASATANVPSPRCTKTSTTPVPPKRCPDGKPLPRSGRCPCPDGMSWSREQSACVGDRPEQPQSCVPGRNEIKTKDGACLCREGYERRDGRCVEEPDEPQSCTPGPNEIKTPKGRCICAEGYERRADGRCIIMTREPENCKPGPNEYRTGQGRCVCKDGFARNNQGICSRETTPGDDCRADGGKWTGERCVFPPKECPRGYKGKYPECRIILPDPPKVPKTCPPGTRGLYPNCIGIVPKHCPPGMIGTPGDCRFPKPPKSTVPPKVTPPPPKIFKPSVLNKPQILKPNINSGPVKKAPSDGGAGLILKKF